MSLKDKFAQLKESFKNRAPLDVQKTMHQATENLKKSDLMNRVVKVGDKAPDFTLKNTKEREVSLSTLLNGGPLVLSFYRGNW